MLRNCERFEVREPAVRSRLGGCLRSLDQPGATLTNEATSHTSFLASASAPCPSSIFATSVFPDSAAAISAVLPSCVAQRATTVHRACLDIWCKRRLFRSRLAECYCTCGGALVGRSSSAVHLLCLQGACRVAAYRVCQVHVGPMLQKQGYDFGMPVASRIEQRQHAGLRGGAS